MVNYTFIDYSKNKDENAHRYVIRGGKDRERDEEKKREREKEREREREKERLRHKHEKVDTKILQEIMTYFIITQN